MWYKYQGDRVDRIYWLIEGYKRSHLGWYSHFALCDWVSILVNQIKCCKNCKKDSVLKMFTFTELGILEVVDEFTEMGGLMNQSQFKIVWEKLWPRRYNKIAEQFCWCSWVSASSLFVEALGFSLAHVICLGLGTENLN